MVDFKLVLSAGCFLKLRTAYKACGLKLTTCQWSLKNQVLALALSSNLFQWHSLLVSILLLFTWDGELDSVTGLNAIFSTMTLFFRIHAEFQLNEPPLLPFWFTPGQFLGNIVIKKDGSHVKSFHLAVPNNRSLNVGEYIQLFCYFFD